MSRKEGHRSIGRDAELAELGARLASHRLCSVVGAPGVGKSLLCTVFGTQGAPRDLDLHDAVRVDLAGTRSREEVAVAIAHALGLRESTPSFDRLDRATLTDRLEHALSAGEADLLILDDADGAVDALAALLPPLLQAAPNIRVLVASRQALRLSAENVLELAPLALPSDDRIETLAASPAVQLLLARAPSLALDPASAPWIAKLVERLDGNPLALELAAARLRTLGLREVVDALAEGLDLLDQGPRDATARHTSLRRAIAASWEPCTAAERQLLRRSAMFEGWFERSALRALTDLPEPIELDALHRVREKSLLAIDSDGRRTRYRLSGPVRAFAREELAREGERPQLERRHARWLADEAEAAASAWRRTASVDGLGFLREHQADFAAAIHALAAHAGDPEGPELAARLTLAFEPLLALREEPARHVAWIEGALEPELPARVRAPLRIALALACERAGESRRGLRELEKARLDAPSDEIAVQIELATAQLHQASGDLALAGEALDRALDVADGLPRARTLRGLGLVAHARGELGTAERHYRDALITDYESATLDARLHCDLGSIRLQQRRFDEAREHYERALALCRATPDPVVIGLTEGNLALLAQEEGNLDEAAERLDRAIEQLGRAGHRLYEAHLTLYRGFLEHERGDLARAIDVYEAAVRALSRIGDRRMAGLAWAGLGAANAERGRDPAAVDAFERAGESLSTIGDRGLDLALRLHRAHLDLTQADRESDPDRARALREEVARSLPAPAALEGSDDARLAARILNRRLGARTLTMLGDSALRMPDGTEIDFTKRDVLRRIVFALARARTDRPGEPVSADRLIEQGWPGERMRYESAINRFKVALSTLRKMGLRDLIVRHDDGYLLDPSVVVRWQP